MENADVVNQSAALAMLVADRVETSARAVLGRSGETPAALVVLGYAAGMTNDALRRILALSHSGTVRLVDRLVADGLVRRGAGRDGREIALHLTERGVDARAALQQARLTEVEQLLSVLSDEECRQFGSLVRALLERQETSEMDRFTICRLCDNEVCTNCPLPTRATPLHGADRAEPNRTDVLPA